MHDWMPGMGMEFGPVMMITFWILGILVIVLYVIVEMSCGRKVKGKFLKKQRRH